MLSYTNLKCRNRGKAGKEVESCRNCYTISGCPFRKTVEKFQKIKQMHIFANINLIVGCRKIGYNYELVEGSSTSVSRKYNGLREIQAQKIIFEYVSENLSLYKRSAAYDYCARLALCYIKFYITGDINMSNKVMKVFRKQCKNNKVILYFPRHASIKRICMLNVLYYTPGC